MHLPVVGEISGSMAVCISISITLSDLKLQEQWTCPS